MEFILAVEFDAARFTDVKQCLNWLEKSASYDYLPKLKGFKLRPPTKSRVFNLGITKSLDIL